jgi:hypothetical protein
LVLRKVPQCESGDRLVTHARLAGSCLYNGSHSVKTGAMKLVYNFSCEDQCYSVLGALLRLSSLVREAVYDRIALGVLFED